MSHALSYSIKTHAKLGTVAGSFCQFRAGQVTYCCRVRDVFVSRRDPTNPIELASVVLLAPQRGAATRPVGSLRHCGGVDGLCACFSAFKAATEARAGERDARRPGPGGASNTAPKSQF